MSPALVLGSLGGLSLLGYLVINFIILQSPPYRIRPRSKLFDGLPLWSAVTHWPLPVPQTNAAGLLLLLTASALAFGSYLAAVWFVRRLPPGRSLLVVLLGFTGLFWLTALLALPSFDDDLFMYISYARVFTAHHANPYTVPVWTFLFDPVLPYDDLIWRNSTLPYGPTWAYLSILWSWLAGAGVVSNLLVFRAGLLGFTIANLVLIWRILGRLNPAYRLVGLVFYAWNPVVVLASQAHVEPVMLFFLLLSIYLYQVHRPLWGLVALALSALTKFITGPLLLVYWVWLARNRWRTALAGGVLVSVLTVLVFLPFWQGPEILLRLVRDPTNGQAGAVVPGYRVFILPGFLAVVAAVSWRRNRAPGDLVRAWAAVLLTFVILLMPQAYAWYLITLLGVVCLVDSLPMILLALTACGTSLLTWMLLLVGRYYSEPSETVLRLIHWGPFLLLMIWFAWRYAHPQLLLMRRRLPTGGKHEPA
ncbi:MAG TPA: hypothetical protein VFM49_23175 [Chloroflexia bacterium]|nr:hypothetical protein [Chloroflexia bacterium]